MLRTKTIKFWYRIHKWTSLVCTAFLLMLCLTGLPLIFYHEIEHLLGNAVEAPALPEGTPMAPVDDVIEAGERLYPDEFVQFVSWDPDEPDIVYLSLAASPAASPENNRLLVVDARTAEVLGEPVLQGSLMFTLYRLHVDMFAGLAGKLFLGLMGLLFVVAIISGVVVYGPFMRRLEFGTVRSDRSRRVRWLDLHNLLGIVTLTWALVVGGTGVINTWADLVIQLWRSDQLAAMVEPYRDAPPLEGLGSLDRAIATARDAAPGMVPSFVAFPGSLFASNHHYAVFMRGETPLTERLLKPALVDAQTGQLTDARDMPWYVTALLVSQPLHFGDYGGMPMKIIWALLDIVTIIVLGSGLYLWVARRKTSVETRIAEIERGEAKPLATVSREAS
ncbi:PepSY-associated TM helix domain-containing protein [Rhodospirillaceae bacterium SYSU D60014]|uniref:PepSY-associated TM helix domain-containing protein n=1 Tax=Virgifigura deserti TaxID=2268457 RepID=UPI000E6641D5